MKMINTKVWMEKLNSHGVRRVASNSFDALLSERGALFCLDLINQMPAKPRRALGFELRSSAGVACEPLHHSRYVFY